MPLVPGDHLAQPQQLLRAREAARRVHEATREPVRARAQRGVQQALHARQFALGHGSLSESNGGEPQSPVTDQRRDVDRVAAAAQSREVLAECAPVPGYGVQPPGVVRPVLDGVIAVSRRERGRRHAAVAGDLRRDTLAHRRLCAWIQQDGKVRVRVRVDEARRDVAIAGVDDPSAAQRPRRADRHDAFAAHGDVAAVPGVATAVDDAPAGDDEVVDGQASPISKIS